MNLSVLEKLQLEDAENHPRKNVFLRALGTESSVSMDIKTMMFEEGDDSSPLF